MQSWKKFPRTILFLTLLTSLLAGLSAPMFVRAAPRALPATNVVISEFRTTGPAGGTDEFVEIYNPTNLSIDISGWKLKKSSGCGVTIGTPLTFPAATNIQSGQYLLIRGAGYSGLTTADYSVTLNLADNGGIAITNASDIIIDQAGMCVTTTFKETTNLNPLTGTANQSYERKLGGLFDSCQDNGDNFADFQLISPSNPQNSSTPLRLCGVTPIPTPTSTNTNTPTLTPTTTNTFTPTLTPIFSLTPSLTPTPGEVVISEIAWSGTQATPNDEWIELYNTRSTPIDLTGWRLVSNSGGVDIVLNGSIPGNGFFLLERARELVTDVSANQIYIGSLPDTGDVLSLSKPNGTVIDTANSDGGTWPAGSGSPNLYSMERVLNGSFAAADNSSGWISNNFPATWITHDAANNLIHGTPGNPNWAFSVTPTFTSTLSPTVTLTPTVTRTSTSTRTPTGTQPTPTPTLSPTQTATPTLNLLINEVAWSGTVSSSDDEWIELYNPGAISVDLTGWKLTALDGSPSISLVGSIPAGGYFVIAANSLVFIDLTPQMTFSGSLSNDGEVLKLVNPSNITVDFANSDGGAWPAGSGSPNYASMERTGKVFDGPVTWATYASADVWAHDRNDKAIKGTPGRANWATTVTLTPTATATLTRAPTRVPTHTSTATFVAVGRPVINEILPRPGFDWNQDGSVDVFDEFIEIKNLGPVDIRMNGWKLDDDANKGAAPFTIPDVILKPEERLVFYSLQTNIFLSDGGATVRLLNPSGQIYDAYTYKIAKAEDKSICRLPDNNFFGQWFEDCIPTPNLINTRNGVVPSMPGTGFESPICDLPDTLPTDFLIAECRGYGAKIWSSFYWDKNGWQSDRYVPENMSKWESFIE